MNRVPVTALKEGKGPFAQNTYYKFHSLNKYPRLIYKVGGILFFDFDEWERMAKEAQAKQLKTSERIRGK